MPKRWDENNDEFEFSGGGNNEEEFWAEYTGEEDIAPDLDDYSIQFREQELELADKHLNTEILDRAIGVARSGFMWHFMTLHGKLRAIREAYKVLLRLAMKKD